MLQQWLRQQCRQIPVATGRNISNRSVMPLPGFKIHALAPFSAMPEKGASVNSCRRDYCATTLTSSTMNDVATCEPSIPSK